MGWVVMGRVAGLFGVRGWVKLHSYTAPRAALLDYDPLYLGSDGQWQAIVLEQGQVHGKGLIAKFAGIDDRDAATRLVDRELAVNRDQLPEPEPGEYYWRDLQGLRVVTLTGVELGRVDHLFDTGANDVMVVHGERERLVPFVEEQVVLEVDLAAGLIRVDWDPEF